MTAILLAALIPGCTEYELSTPADELGAVDHDTDRPADSAPPEPSTFTGDSWDLPDNPQVDVVFFGDTSGSMQIELKELGARVQDFVDRLDDDSPDWQLIAVTGPDGCGNNGVLTPATPDYGSLFAEGVLQPPGEDKVDEWGLYNTAAAVEQTDPGECNEGFLRPNAKLHVIFVSDEDDNSPGWNKGDPEYWRVYTESIETKKASEMPIRFSAVAGPQPKGCEGAEVGTGYWEATEASLGAFLSICETDWSQQLVTLAEVTMSQWVFPLSDAPDPSTLEVWINALRRPSGWVYEAEPNHIRFEENPPINGDEVRILYDALEE